MNEELQAAGAIAKDPGSYSYLTYGWILFLSMCGGVVRVIREVKLGEKTWLQLAWIFVVELFTSGFVGVVTFYACEAAGIRPLVTAVMVSVSGWMGVRALSVLESIYKARGPKGD